MNSLPLLSSNQIWKIQNNQIVCAKKSRCSIRNICAFMDVLQYLKHQPINRAEAGKSIAEINKSSSEVLEKAIKIQACIQRCNIFVRFIIKCRIFLSRGKNFGSETHKYNKKLMQDGVFLSSMTGIRYPVLFNDAQKALQNLESYNQISRQYSPPKWAKCFPLAKNPILYPLYLKMQTHWKKAFESMRKGKDLTDPTVMEHCHIALELGSLAFQLSVKYDSLPSGGNLSDDDKAQHRHAMLIQQRSFGWIVGSNYSKMYLWLRSLPTYDQNTRTWKSQFNDENVQDVFCEKSSLQYSWREKYNADKQLFLDEVGLGNFITENDVGQIFTALDDFRALAETKEFRRYMETTNPSVQNGLKYLETRILVKSTPLIGNLEEKWKKLGL